MAKVYIRLDQANFTASTVSVNYRKEAGGKMLEASRDALRSKCQVELDPKPVPASGLSLGGGVESLTFTPEGSQTKVKAVVKLELSQWPAPSNKTKTAVEMFGLLTGNAIAIDGSSDKQVRESALAAIRGATYAVIRNRIDTGITAWQQKSNVKLDICKEDDKKNKATATP